MPEMKKTTPTANTPTAVFSPEMGRVSLCAGLLIGSTAHRRSTLGETRSGTCTNAYQLWRRRRSTRPEAAGRLLGPTAAYLVDWMELRGNERFRGAGRCACARPPQIL